MKDLCQRGFGLALLLCLLSVVTITAMAGTLSSHTYRLVDSTEYMDKTYVFTLQNQQVETSVQAFCAEYAAPTFDAKRGLIDWIDYNVYELEQVFDYDIAGRIRSIMSTAGPQIEQEVAIDYFQDHLGIMNVSYEDIVSAVQYSVWYYTDDLMIVPSSENGYDIYKHLITLPPTSTVQPTDLIRLTPIQIVENYNGDQVTMVYQYDTSGYSAEVAHRYNIDIKTQFNAVEEVTKTNSGLRTVSLTFPLLEDDVAIEFDVIVEGRRRLTSDIYSFTPEDRGTLQSMVGFTRLDESIGLDSKHHSFQYVKHGLTIENDGLIVNESFVSGRQVGMSEIENLNPSGKIQHTFDGWYHKSGGKMNADGVFMDGPQHITAKYSPVSGSGSESGGGSNPDGGSDPDGGNNPDGGSNPDGSDPDQSTEDPSDDPEQPDTDIIADEHIPEGIIDNPFKIDPDEPVKGVGELEVIDDPDIPLVSPEIMNPPYGPEGFEGEGEFFYYINRFAETGGVPFVIFFLLGVLALGLGAYLSQNQDNSKEEVAIGAGVSGITDLVNDVSIPSKAYHDNPFHDE